MMDEKKILINTQGGPVINGGTFTNVEFVAQKHVYYQEPERKNSLFAFLMSVLVQFTELIFSSLR